jgi:hypothetical protein
MAALRRGAATLYAEALAGARHSQVYLTEAELRLGIAAVIIESEKPDYDYKP